MHNKTLLFYKVFKAKFFPHCSVLDAKLNAGGSFAWKSIMGAREVIKKRVDVENWEWGSY